VVCLSGVVLGAERSVLPPVLEELLRMQTALQNLNYHGTLVFLQDGRIQSMRVVHKVDQDGEYERLVSLNGVAREVIRENDVVTCYIPDQQLMMVGTHSSVNQQSANNVWAKLAENDFSRLQDVYHFEWESEDRVAGLLTQRVLIRPRDAFRYGYRLWLERDNGLLLKSDLLGDGDHILEQVMFTDVAVVDSIPVALLKPTTLEKGLTVYRRGEEEQPQKVMDSDWQVAHLPQGFVVTGRYRHPRFNSTQPTEHWMLTDGLASVSIYIEKLADGHAATFEGGARMGAVNAYGARVEGYQVAVIGGVPGRTVELIARSISFKPTIVEQVTESVGRP
jgi:sigma-E factor negative regulatory protein RseB